MRFFKVLLLLGFVLVFAKAHIETQGDEAVVEIDEQPDIAAESEAALMDEPNEEVKRRLIPPRPPYRVIVNILVNSDGSSPFFLTCYCFTRICYGECLLTFANILKTAI